jgi:hypothetical protein
MSTARRVLGVLLAAAAVLLLGACRADLTVDVQLERDGSGVVEAGLALDEEAAAELDALETDLQVEDLQVAGWEVTGPAVEDDGRTWIRLSKPFPSAEQLDDVLAELHPRLFPAASAALTRDLERTTYAVTLQVDTSMRVEDFSDPDAAALLGTPLGFDAAALAERAGGSLDGAVSITLQVSLPDGSVVEYPPADQPDLTLGGTGVTEFKVDTTVLDPEVAAELDSADRYRGVLPWIWGATVVWWLLVAAVVVWVVRRRRSRRVLAR